MKGYTFDEVVQETVADSTILDVDVSLVDANPHQPRKQFDQESLEEMAESIKMQGILQPILIEKHHDRYIVIAGERRLRAAKLAGAKKIPAIVKEFTEEKRLEAALIENLQRENLNPLEEAKAYRFMIDSTGISQEEMSRRLGKKRSTITNNLRLLNLPEVMQEALANGIISSGHARSLLSVVNPADQQILFKQIADQGISVREAEQRAQQLNNGSRASKQNKKRESVSRPPEITEMEQQFLEALGTKVSIKGDLKKGKVEITYYSHDDLERIYELLSPDNAFGEEL